MLDAFAGSGTTGHAVLRLNKQDGGGRRFILIEEGSGDDKYARTLTSPRLKKAIAKEGLPGGFTFLKTGRSLDREAILGLEREKIVNVICRGRPARVGSCGIAEGILIAARRRHRELERTRRQRGDRRGRERRPEGGHEARAPDTDADLRDDVSDLGDRRAKFCQIPDEILAALYLDARRRRRGCRDVDHLSAVKLFDFQREAADQLGEAEWVTAYASQGPLKLG